MDKYMKCKIFAMTFIMAICFVAGLLFKDWLNDGAAPESALAIAALIITFAIFFWKCEIDGENSRYDDTGHLSMGIFSTSDKNPLLDKKENFVTDTKVSFSTPDPIEDGLFDGKMSHKVVFLGSEGLSYTAEYLKNLEKNLEGLNEASNQIFQINKAKGFWDNERNIGELLMLVTSELGEAMEAHRKGNFADWDKFATNPGTHNFESEETKFNTSFSICIKDTFEDEIADAVIRLLDLSAGLGIDLERHINAKVKFNTSRPKLHGKSY